MSISVTYNSSLSVVETLGGVFVSPADATVTFDQLNETGTLTASTSVPVTKHADYEKTMSAGAGTIDLTALPGKTADETVDGTGLKVQFLKLKNKSTNANKITVSQGASTAYRLDGATNWSVVLAPGQSALFLLNAAAEAVSSSHKTIDLAGTGSQVLQVQVVLG